MGMSKELFADVNKVVCCQGRGQPSVSTFKMLLFSLNGSRNAILDVSNLGVSR